MLEVALVLFALLEYDSPAVAGAAAFLSSVPGLVAAPGVAVGTAPGPVLVPRREADLIAS
jgi:hypothetical protein